MRSVRLLAVLAFATCLLGTALDAQLVDVWTVYYDGALGQDDHVLDVAADEAGNSFVVGFERVQPQPGLFVPAWRTVKYDDQGNELWNASFQAGPATMSCWAEKVELAPNGDVVVAGAIKNGGDWAVVRYDANGNELWSHVQSLGISFVATPAVLALDAVGNAYVAGDTSFSPGSWVLFQVPAGGGPGWVFSDDGGGSGAGVLDLVVDDVAGALYVAGWKDVPSSATDVAVRRLDLFGSLVWERTYGGAGSLSYERGSGVALDSAGNVLVGATYWSGGAARYDAAVLKYDAAGTRLWSTIWNGPGGRNDSCWGVAVGPNDEAFAVGEAELGGSDDDAFTLALEPDGTLRWARTLDAGGGALNDVARFVGADDLGRVVLAGYATPQPGREHLFVASYGSDGTLLSNDVEGGPSGDQTYPFGLAVLGDGRAWVVADTPGIGTQTDALTRYYAPSGLAATVVSRNGSGVNPSILATSDRPVLGTTLSASVFGGAIGASGATALFAFLRPLVPGVLIAQGEVLLDVTSTLLFLQAGSLTGGTATHVIPVPADPALGGLGLSLQAFLPTAGAVGRLTNALDLTLGAL